MNVRPAANRTRIADAAPRTERHAQRLRISVILACMTVRVNVVFSGTGQSFRQIGSLPIACERRFAGDPKAPKSRFALRTRPRRSFVGWFLGLGRRLAQSLGLGVNRDLWIDHLANYDAIVFLLDIRQG